MRRFWSDAEYEKYRYGPINSLSEELDQHVDLLGDILIHEEQNILESKRQFEKEVEDERNDDNNGKRDWEFLNEYFNYQDQLNTNISDWKLKGVLVSIVTLNLRIALKLKGIVEYHTVLDGGENFKSFKNHLKKNRSNKEFDLIISYVKSVYDLKSPSSDNDIKRIQYFIMLRDCIIHGSKGFYEKYFVVASDGTDLAGGFLIKDSSVLKDLLKSMVTLYNTAFLKIENDVVKGWDDL